MKIKGLNEKEQKCYDVLCDGAPHTIAELKKKFVSAAKQRCEETYEKGSWDEVTVEIHSQSFARNSIRRLIRDGWVEKKAYGTYQLTRSGKAWVAAGKDATASFGVKRGRKPMTDQERAASQAKKEAKKAKKVEKAKKAKEAKKAKKVEKAKATSKAETATKEEKRASAVAKSAGKTIDVKAPEKVETVKAVPEKPKATNGVNGKAVAQKKALEARKRAAKAAAVEKAQQSLAEESNVS